MKGLVCLLLLLETFVFVEGGLNENDISQQLSSGDRRQNPPQTDTEASTEFPDIYATLRELTATVTEQKEINRALETRLRDAEQAAEQQTISLEELEKKTDETLSQVEELRQENRDREIAFSASLMESGNGYVGPFTTDITLTYKNVYTNIGNAYNPITGVFTAPLKGAYMFRFSLYGYGPTPLKADIVKNGKRVAIADVDQPQKALHSSNGVVLILEVGDAVYMRLHSGHRIYDNSQNNHCTFSGFLLFPL